MASDEFCQQHLIRHLKQQQSLIIQTSFFCRQWFHLNPTSRRMTSFSLCIPNEEYAVLQSSNGLLLLQPQNWGYDDYLYVHNPATKQSRKIMLTPSTTHPDVTDAALAFDPSKSPYYKVVCIRLSSTRWLGGCRIEVYSSESHTWNKEPYTRRMGLLFDHYLPNKLYSVYWNNALFWSSDGMTYYYCFDIAKGEIRPFPACEPNPNVFWQLQESNDHLFFIKLVGSEVECEKVEIWELEMLGDDEYYDHWLLRQEFVLPKAQPPLMWWMKQLNILTFMVDTCSLMLICRDGPMRVYNLNNGSYEDFLDATGQPFFPKDYVTDYLRAFHFRGTLALV